MDGAGGAATFLDMRATPERLRLRLQVGDELLEVEVALQPATAHALAHLIALHGHGSGCARRVDLHAGLLRRCLTAAGAALPAVVVRADPVPAFWLHFASLASVNGVARLKLDLLDAVTLLMSDRFAVFVVRDEVLDWDGELRRLLEESGA